VFSAHPLGRRETSAKRFWLARRNNIEEITAIYGLVIVDDCHHVAASAFFHVLSRIPARYRRGLTATPERRDGLEDLIYHQLGSHHVTLESPGPGQLPTDEPELCPRVSSIVAIGAGITR
jgi:Type III restriction enzyme, res subunit